MYDLTLCKGLSPDDCADVIPCVKKYKIKMAELHNETVRINCILYFCLHM